MFNYETFKQKLDRIQQKNIFFVAGVPKSGTTWLQNILNGHTDIFCGGESLFNRFIPMLETATTEYNQLISRVNGHNQNRQDFAQFQESTTDELFFTAVCLLLDSMPDTESASFVGDKTPEYFQHADKLMALFPNAKIVYIVRDGRDVTVSGWAQNMRLYGDEYLKQFPDFLSYIPFCAEDWAKGLQEAKAFGEAYPASYHQVRYEDLHTAPEQSVQKILSFLGADDSTAAVTACLESGSFKKLSAGRKQGEEDTKSFFRKGIAGDWVNHFDDEALQAFMGAAGDALLNMGYPEQV